MGSCAHAHEDALLQRRRILALRAGFTGRIMQLDNADVIDAPCDA